jgi:hypothetical protein
VNAPPDLDERLARVGLDRHSARVLAVLPLVYVAWADGVVQGAERALIEAQVRDLSPSEDALLAARNWLAFRPSAALMARGTEALAALLASAPAPGPTPKTILAYCRRVADAAGGVLGVGATSRAEQRAITLVARALQVSARRAWRPEAFPDAGPESAAPEPPSKTAPVVFHTRETPGVRAVAVLIGESGERCPVGRAVTLGRGRDNDVQVDEDPRVSRQHCRIEQRAGRFYLVDLDTTAGTFVDGDRVLERRLLGGETIRLGGSTFRFERTRVSLVVTEP